VLLRNLNTTLPIPWGTTGDAPLAGDFDGDHRGDPAVYRPGEGRWHIDHTAIGRFGAVDWGLSTDVPVPADYDGDGRLDIAVWRPSIATWFVKDQFRVMWGASGDVPALQRN
jgi:hypothetical protein